jgi:hypothetical protein
MSRARYLIGMLSRSDFHLRQNERYTKASKAWNSQLNGYLMHIVK